MYREWLREAIKIRDTNLLKNNIFSIFKQKSINKNLKRKKKIFIVFKLQFFFPLHVIALSPSFFLARLVLAWFVGVIVVVVVVPFVVVVWKSTTLILSSPHSTTHRRLTHTFFVPFLLLLFFSTSRPDLLVLILNFKQTQKRKCKRLRQTSVGFTTESLYWLNVYIPVYGTGIDSRYKGMDE